MVMSTRLSSAKEHSLLLLREVMNDIDSHGKGILDFQRASTDKQRQRPGEPRDMLQGVCLCQAEAS